MSDSGTLTRKGGHLYASSLCQSWHSILETKSWIRLSLSTQILELDENKNQRKRNNIAPEENFLSVG